MRPQHDTALPPALLHLIWQQAGRPAHTGRTIAQLLAAATAMADAADTLADMLRAYARDTDAIAAALETPHCPCGKVLPVQATGRRRVWCADDCPARRRTRAAG